MDEARKAVKKQLLQTLMQQAVEDLASESDDAIKEQIQSVSIDLEPLRLRIEQVAQEQVQRATRIDDAVLTNMVHGCIENVDLEVYRKAVDHTVGSVLHSHIEDIARSVAEEQSERLVAASDVESLATAAMRSRVTTIMSGLDVDIHALMDAEAERRVDTQSALVAQATEVVRDLLVTKAVDAAMTHLDEDAIHQQIQAEASRRTDHASPLVEQVSSQLRDALVQKAADVAIARLDDVDQVAREARELVSFDNDAIVAASTQLRGRILQDIARRTTKSFGDADDVASDAADWIDVDQPELVAAAERVRVMALGMVRTNVEEMIARTDEMAEDAGLPFTDQHESVQAAVQLTHDRIVQSVSRIVKERLADTKQIAAAAADTIPAESDAIQRIVKATLSLIVGDVIQITQDRLSQVEKLSSDARTRMPERLSEVQSAASILENMLLQEVSEEAVSYLHDIERTCNAARGKVTDESPIMVAAAAMVDRLQQEVAAVAVKDLASIDAHADAAISLVPSDHPNLNAIHQEVQTRLVARVTESALDAIMETDVQEWVRSDDARLESVRNVLRERIIGRILADTLGGLGQQANQSSDLEERALFQEAMHAVAKQQTGWKPLSDISDHVAAPVAEPEPVATPVPEPEPEAVATPEPEPTPVAKSWEVSEIFARAGDGHDVVLDVPAYEDHIYVYGIVDVDELHDQDLDGLEGIETGSDVYICSNGDLSAIVSSVPAAIYGKKQLDQGMNDAAWVKEQVRRHAAVLSAIGAPRSIVPLKFGVVRASMEDVKHYLDSHSTVFHETLGRLSNKQEFSVRIRVDLHRLGEHVLESDARIDASLNDMSSGVAGFIRDELKLRNQDPDEQEMATIIQNVVGQAHARLQDLSSESVFMNAPPAGPKDVQRVVLNATYLVSTARDAAFDAEVNDMANQFRHLGFEIQVSGPWAPYHFVHLNDESQEIPA